MTHTRDDAPKHLGRVRATPRQDLITAMLYAWPVIGLYLDGWAHHNVANLETFFTPWHAVFYSGYIVSSAWMLSLVEWKLVSRGMWRQAVPVGYGLGVIGVGIFFVGGIGDMVWHTIFGVEKGLDTLFSPTHLILLTGALFASLTPFRSAWASEDRTLRLAPLLSVIVFTSAIAFFFGFASPFSRSWTAFDASVVVERLRSAGIDDAQFILRTTENMQLRGIAGALFNAMIMVGPVLLLMRRWAVPFGAVTLLFVSIAALNASIYNLASWELVLAASLAGLAGDWLIRATRRLTEVRALRIVGSLLPFATLGLPFLATAMRRGIGWPPELWTGTLFFAILAGFALSYLMLPPLPPGQAEQTSVS